MASHPPSQCCTVGVKHEGETMGVLAQIGGNIDVYIAAATSKIIHKDVAILLVPDVMGISQNSKLVADQYADNGYYTLMIDAFYGDAIPFNIVEQIDLPKWLAKHTTKHTDPIVEAGVKYLREEKGFKKIAGVGYCFGAKYVIRFMNGRGIDVGYSAHPSFVDAQELKDIKGPFAISAAETDHIFSTEKRHESEVILKETKQQYQIYLYSGVEHGFAVRCDLSNEKQKFAKEQAFYQAITWFNHYLT